MPRRTKQTGYIYQRGNWWIVRYRENLLEDGHITRRQLAKKIEPVKPEHKRLKRAPDEVVERAAELLQPVNQHTSSPEATQTLEAFVDNVYFPNISSQKRASTVTGYKNRWESQLKPRCGNYRLRDFRTCDGQKLLADVARANRTLLRSTLRHLRSLLSGIFKHAIQQGFLNGPNPMREVGTPNAAEGEDGYAYSLEEVTKILLHLPQPASAICAVASFAGLRRSELRGLRWEDYDGAQIFVRHSVWEGHINEPKTKKSKAPVPVIPALARILDSYRQQCGNPVSGVMFSSSKGTPLNLNNVVNRTILRTLRKAGIVWHGWHAFRRGLASTLNRLGVDDSVIQRILRHSNVAVTQNHYIKTVDADATAAMNLLESLLCANCAPNPTPTAQLVVN